MKLDPSNRTAQLSHRALGNPEVTLPHTAISNCFPGLEFDFRNLWRRTFVGLVLLENSNLVVDAEDPKFKHLVGHRLLKVDDIPTVTAVHGPRRPNDDDSPLAGSQSFLSAAFTEWSNTLAAVLQKQGQTVKCVFTKHQERYEGPAPTTSSGAVDPDATITVDLEVRHFFAGESASPSKELIKPGEMTHGLCSPWQNDYRECACYYWAASRPDFVNAEPGADGLTHGDMWMSKVRTGEYIPDDRVDGRLYSYDDLFREWQTLLQFQVRGHDAEQSS
jgi:hypothetical protein